MLVTASGAVLASEEIGYIKTLQGQAYIERSGTPINADLGKPLYEGDRVRVDAQSSVGISFKDETLVSLGAGSHFVINRYTYDPTTRAGQVETSIVKGTLRFVSGLIGKNNPQSVKVNTPTATMGLRGTDFIVEVPDAQ